MLFFEAVQKFTAWRSFSLNTLTNRKYVQELRLFCLYVRNTELEKVGLEDVLSYLHYLKEFGWDQNALIAKITVLKKFFKFYKDQGVAVLSPDLIPVVRYRHRIAKVMTEEIHQKLLATLKTNLEDDLRNRLLLMMLKDTGARNSEVLSLNIEDLDLEKKEAVIRTKKSRGGVSGRPFRQVMWTNKTNEVLQRYLELREKQGPLFVSLAFNNYGQRLKNNGLDRIMRIICDQAGVEHYTPHTYRHEMAHDILEKTGNIVKVAKVLGHTTPRSSMSYLHLNDREMKEIYREVKGD